MALEHCQHGCSSCTIPTLGPLQRPPLRQQCHGTNPHGCGVAPTSCTASPLRPCENSRHSKGQGGEGTWNQQGLAPTAEARAEGEEGGVGGLGSGSLPSPAGTPPTLCLIPHHAPLLAVALGAGERRAKIKSKGEQRTLQPGQAPFSVAPHSSQLESWGLHVEAQSWAGLARPNHMWLPVAPSQSPRSRTWQHQAAPGQPVPGASCAARSTAIFLSYPQPSSSGSCWGPYLKFLSRMDGGQGKQPQAP